MPATTTLSLSHSLPSFWQNYRFFTSSFFTRSLSLYFSTILIWFKFKLNFNENFWGKSFNFRRTRNFLLISSVNLEISQKTSSLLWKISTGAFKTCLILATVRNGMTMKMQSFLDGNYEVRKFECATWRGHRGMRFVRLNKSAVFVDGADVFCRVIFQ